VIVCEADPLDAAIVLSVLSQAGHDGIAVSSAEALRDEIARQETRGVVLSENLPGVDGRRLCSDLRADDFRGVIVLLTGSASVDREVTALEGGADAAVAKPIEPRLLLAHLDAAGRRRTESESLSWDLVRVADAELSLRQQRLAIGDRRPVYVTTTEARLLEYLMRNSPLTVTRDALVEQTWPHDELVDANRVDVSMARLRKKVEPEPAHPAYIHTTRGIGYYFCPPSRVWNGERRDGG
jgi:DNA-binding response OmpR family regulator